jgi:hypothetical protein
VKYTVDTSGETFPDADFVYLGRFQYGALSVGSVTMDVGGALAGFVHTPVSIWIAPKQPSYASGPGTVSYSDTNSVPAGWQNLDGTQFLHYWQNGTENTNVFRASQFYPLPAADRQPGTNLYDVDFTHFDIWHSQFAQLPLTIYFKPGGAFTPPSVGGFIASVDASAAAAGRVRVEVTWPGASVCNDGTNPKCPGGCGCYPANTFSLGQYEFDQKLYGVRFDNYPTRGGTDAIGP